MARWEESLGEGDLAVLTGYVAWQLVHAEETAGVNGRDGTCNCETCTRRQVRLGRWTRLQQCGRAWSPDALRRGGPKS